MDEIIAFCGITCHECGAFLATRDDNDEKRAEVAQLWSKEFKADLSRKILTVKAAYRMARIFSITPRPVK